MKRVSLLALALFAVACQSSLRARQSPELEAESADRKAWNDYVQKEVGSDSIKADCMPRLIRADPEVGRQGLVMFFHGLNSCPEEFAALSERLSRAGFDVYLPLLPGHGRSVPPTQGADAMEQQKNFVKTMNAIARLAPRGEKVLAGLAAGGALSMEAAQEGSSSWDRVLVYAPPAGASLDLAERIKVPMQWVAVREGGDTEVNALQNAAKKARNLRLCFYPEGVPHAMLRRVAAESAADAYWLPALEEDSLAFITRGRWFWSQRMSSDVATCRYIL